MLLMDKDLMEMNKHQPQDQLQMDQETQAPTLQREADLMVSSTLERRKRTLHLEETQMEVEVAHLVVEAHLEEETQGLGETVDLEEDQEQWC